MIASITCSGSPAIGTRTIAALFGVAVSGAVATVGASEGQSPLKEHSEEAFPGGDVVVAVVAEQSLTLHETRRN